MLGGAQCVRLTRTKWICHTCARRQRALLGHGQRRSIHLSYLKKQRDAANDWKKQAAEIRAGEKQSMLDILEERGYIGQIAGLG